MNINCLTKYCVKVNNAYIIRTGLREDGKHTTGGYRSREQRGRQTAPRGIVDFGQKLITELDKLG